MRDDASRLAAMLEAIARIRRFTLSGRAAFYEDRKSQDAVAFEILIIGEAARQASSGFRSANPRVPWKALTELRNRLVHEYFRLDPEDVWTFVSRELEGLERALRRSDPARQ